MELSIFQRVTFRSACGVDRSVWRAELESDCRLINSERFKARTDSCVWRSVRARWTGAEQAVVSPRRKLAGRGRATRVLTHTHKLGKSPLFKRHRQMWPHGLGIQAA